MKKIIVLGGSGIGMIASSIIDKMTGYELLGFVNDVVPVGNTIGKYKKIKVIDKTENIQKYITDEEIYFFNGFVGMTREKEVYETLQKLGIPKERYVNLIDPTAIVPWDYCSIGQGVLMAPLSQLSSDTNISDNCMLLANTFIGHDTFLDQYVSVATNAVIGANVHVGKACHIGSNATIREKVKIGDFSLVGMGAVVLKDVPENSIVAGNPARVIKTKNI
ncbi:acetyltransferase EpsM [Catalinimonas alkaloidigena]|uniref:NeuD/PglB/VioB family sugar acetyltransferase n=1 Tax=Catalinimonas alkaloidigena TaxID=1075417 RepID=UPI002405A48C|nr:NeuD/PglB/VioB family sugar acetyltransferase [Catalinimonas alkaloidigena]MDF9801103.1 acetyltransferase EpsM [Catalinimonas alkaloidigena]